MALCNSKRHIQSYIFLSCLLTMAICFPYGTALIFNLTNIDTRFNANITVDGKAYISSQGIQVTSVERNERLQRQSGRAMYKEPLHLWDKTSRNLTDFDTHFVFVINSEGAEYFADGLAFFLIPSGDANITAGSAMGLPIDLDTFNATSPFVAVEFDTYNNVKFDPNISTHVGIDINSIRSNVTSHWYCNLTSRIENEAWIHYDSRSQNLSIVFTGSIDNNNTRVMQGLSLLVDLREYLPEWVRIGFSAATGDLFERNNVISWQFNSSLQIDEKTVPSPSPNPNGFIPEEKKGEGMGTGLIVGLIVGLSVLVAGLALLGLFLWKRRDREREREEGAISFELSMVEDFEMGNGPKRFSYVELCRATDNFNEEQKLGEGGFGGVYRGFLKELNLYVAVKRISKGSKQGIKEYAAEVKIISQLRHRNLVQLIGWCHENKDLLLVYEYMANASLDIHLFKDKSLLTWETRFKVAKGLASALLYLHEEWEQCVVHRDVKSSNVMLDQNFNAKLGDFGLARLVDHEKVAQTTLLAGTMGYMAPECVVMGKASKESDVYSFGIVALEIASGRKPIISMFEDHVRLVEFVWNLYGDGNLLDAVDPKIGTEFDREEMERLMIVGLWCAHPDYNVRPSMRHALHVLNFETHLPKLPGRMPVATYFDHPVNFSLSSIFTDGSTISGNSQTKSSGYTYTTDSSKVTSSSSSSLPSTLILPN